MTGLNPIAKAIIAFVVAAGSTFAAGAAANTSLPMSIATAVVAGVVALGTAWALEPPAVKAFLSGVVAAGGAFLASYGHADALQITVSAVVAFCAGAGLIAGTTNGARILRR